MALWVRTSFEGKGKWCGMGAENIRWKIQFSEKKLLIKVPEGVMNLLACPDWSTTLTAPLLCISGAASTWKLVEILFLACRVLCKGHFLSLGFWTNSVLEKQYTIHNTQATPPIKLKCVHHDCFALIRTDYKSPWRHVKCI